jgi:hypothetical protein
MDNRIIVVPCGLGAFSLLQGNANRSEHAHMHFPELAGASYLRRLGRGRASHLCAFLAGSRYFYKELGPLKDSIV